jgi:P22_AR N-terminal domain
MDDNGSPALYLQTLTVSRWEFETPVAQDGTTQYFPIRHSCLWLGIDSRTQINVLKGGVHYDGALREIPYLTDAGWRPAVWIRRDKLGRWLLDVDAKRCKLRSRDKLEEFQEDVLREAEKMLFGAAPNAPADARGLVSADSTVRVEVHMACLDCGAPHFIVWENGEATVVRERRGDA